MRLRIEFRKWRVSIEIPLYSGPCVVRKYYYSKKCVGAKWVDLISKSTYCSTSAIHHFWGSSELFQICSVHAQCCVATKLDMIEWDCATLRLELRMFARVGYEMKRWLTRPKLHHWVVDLFAICYMYDMCSFIDVRRYTGRKLNHLRWEQTIEWACSPWILFLRMTLDFSRSTTNRSIGSNEYLFSFDAVSESKHTGSRETQPFSTSANNRMS